MCQIAIDDNMPLKYRGQERLRMPTALASCDGGAWLLPTKGLVGDTGLEPVTSCMSSKCSNQLS